MADDVMRPKSVGLIALLESGDLDYAFEYTSVAAQHNLKYVKLPTKINLSDENSNDFYSQAKVEIAGSEPGDKITMTGKAIVYGVTIPSDFERMDIALAWVEFLLGPEGVSIMEANGQPAVVPVITNDKSKLPEALLWNLWKSLSEGDRVIRTPGQKKLAKEILPAMADSQENGTTILLDT